MNISTYLRNVDAFVGLSNTVAGVYHYDYAARSIYGQILFDRDMDFRVTPLDDSWVGNFSILEYQEDYGDGVIIYHLVIVPTVTVYNFNLFYRYNQNRELVWDKSYKNSTDVWVINGA